MRILKPRKCRNYAIINKYIWNIESKEYQKLHKKDLNPNEFIWAASPRSSEKELKLLGNFKNKKILELGCGGGQCSIWLAKNGGNCVGLDISKAQLNYAKVLQKKNNVKFPLIEGNAEDLSYFQEKSFDIIFSVFGAIGFININKCFKEINRILRDGGIFVFSWYSPIFDCYPHKGKNQLRIYRSYFNQAPIYDREIVLVNNPKRSKLKAIDFHYTYGDWYRSLVKNGFFLIDIIEPPVYDNDNWNSTWKNFPKYKIKMIPSTTIWKSIKLSYNNKNLKIIKNMLE